MPSSEPWSIFQPVVLGSPVLILPVMLVKSIQPSLQDLHVKNFQLKNTQAASIE